MTNDIISNMLTKIRNANLAKHYVVQVESTKITNSIIKVLHKEGFIYKYEEIEKKPYKHLLISLKYKGKEKKKNNYRIKKD